MVCGLRSRRNRSSISGPEHAGQLAARCEPARAPGFPDAWRAVQYVESHDEVYRDRSPRIPKLAVADGDTRTWHATSRSRVAAGLILTAPGIPMLFMGQKYMKTSAGLMTYRTTKGRWCIGTAWGRTSR